jgi:far upstream element-binding protein
LLKCGLIIGKGGETIKRLSEQHGVKLVVIQDPDTPQSADKPLRITGEPEKVANCKEMGT